MAGYITGVIIMGAVGSLLAMMLPRENGSSQYVRYISQLAVLLVLLSPLSKLSTSLLSFAVDVPFYEMQGDLTDNKEAVISKSAENISMYIKEICASQFSFDTENVRIKLILNDEDPENVIIEEVQIFTSEKDSDKRAEAAEYFKETLLTDVYVFGP